MNSKGKSVASSSSTSGSLGLFISFVSFIIRKQTGSKRESDVGSKEIV